VALGGRLLGVNISDIVGGALMAIGLLTVLILLGVVLVAMAKNLPLAKAEGPLGLNLLRQQRLYTSYREWLKANRSGDHLTFDQWKEANGK
jgi:hypothetical protein